MKRKKSEPAASNWMDTYGDMVTLLLCFFVLLYSISTVDEQKWIAVVKSFNPDADLNAYVLTDELNDKGDPVENLDYMNPQEAEEAEAEQAAFEQMMQDLYDMLKEYVEQQGAENNISVAQGDGYVFITLDNAVFFDGDSYAIRPEGQNVLQDLGMVLTQAAPAIDEIRVMGHTAQASAARENDPYADRFLASNRATEVLIYLQNMGFIDPARLVSLGYGQHRPISSNETAETREDNRRVELIIAGRDVTSELGDSVKNYYTQRASATE